VQANVWADAVVAAVEHLGVEAAAGEVEEEAGAKGGWKFVQWDHNAMMRRICSDYVRPCTDDIARRFLFHAAGFDARACRCFLRTGVCHAVLV
jgi:O-methyltransferase involved in polyketide biosynthesis